MVRQLAPNVTKFQTKCGVAIEQYLKEASKGSKHTERNYRSRINRFLKHVYEKTIDTVTFEELDLMDYDSFTQYIDSFEEVKNNTINNHMSAVKELLRDLKGRNLLRSDIAYLDSIKPENNDGKEIEYMSVDVVERYISEAGRELHNAEAKQKLIMLAADQGLRLEALLNLSWGSFMPRENGVVLTGYDKGNKKFTKVISYYVYEDLLKLRKEASIDSKVFSPLSPKNVTDMMIRIKVNLGYEDISYSFHSLRKSAGTWVYRYTNDILEAQKALGHDNLNNTQIYVKNLDYGVMGMFSLRNHDSEAYKKLSHEELLDVLDTLSGDFLHVLNAKIQQK